MTNIAHEYTFLKFLEILSVLLIFVLGLFILAIIILFIIDKVQTKHSIRHNYPVIGRFRYVFEEWGVFFRQYFFAMDRQEMPFNRAERSWVYRAAKAVDRTLAFGSSRVVTEPGTINFVNCQFPTLSEDAVEAPPVTIGPYVKHPYTAHSFFNISGMSYGALSKPAIQALSKGAAMAGCWLNTGEGGVSSYHFEGGADLVFQIGTAKYGVRKPEGGFDYEKLKVLAAYDQIKMFELKLSQGAKPGKGGLLPGAKVTQEIAEIRRIYPGQDSISPNGHPEIKSVGDLLDMIEKIRIIVEKPVGIKTVLGRGEWLDDLFAEINRRGEKSAPDFITLDGADGGTGAAPQPLLDYMGLLLRESLPLLVDKLNEYGLRKRIKVIASGKLMLPSKVAWALACGADFVNNARGFMFALGCIQALKCNKNTCPTGVTTHNKRLQAGLNPQDKAVRVANYHQGMTYDVGMIAHSCGVKEPRALKRHHVRIMGEMGKSIPFDELYPEVKER